MYDMILILFLLFQSDETDEIIKQLNNDSYYIRETATEKLVLQGVKIFPILDKIKNNTEDLEIKWRCEEVKKRYYSVAPDNLSIWMLPIEYRFLTEEETTIDIAQKYFDQCKGTPAEKAILATHQYFMDQLNDDKISRAELITLRKKMIQNTKKIQEKYGAINADVFYITEPIESRLISRPKLKEQDEEDFFDT